MRRVAVSSIAWLDVIVISEQLSGDKGSNGQGKQRKTQSECDGREKRKVTGQNNGNHDGDKKPDALECASRSPEKHCVTKVRNVTRESEHWNYK